MNTAGTFTESVQVNKSYQLFSLLCTVGQGFPEAVALPFVVEQGCNSEAKL